MSAHFYCQNLTGATDFCIHEWNAAYLELIVAGISETEMTAILSPPACKEQCFACMAIVGERRIKTQKALSKRETP